MIKSAAVTLILLSSLSTAVKADNRPTLYSDIMPTFQVKAGMTGYGLTVFRGTKIERFGVVVVDVVRKGSLIAPGHDMILVKMSGGPMTLRGANIIHGMSGSPVYVNGKIIGAFSQGEPASKEPLGGVTPIEDMLEAWDPNLPTSVSNLDIFSARRDTANLTHPFSHNGQQIKQVQFNTPTSTIFHRQSNTVYMQPCTTIAAFTTSSKSVRDRLAAFLKPYNVELATGSSGAQDPQFKGTSLVPGSAFGMMLVTGDLSMGAFGTVTYRKADRILGFGHPFMGMGAVDAAFCSAYVHDVYPLLTASYKICSAGPIVGSSVQDRMFGVSGNIGPKPTTIPIVVHVTDTTTKRTRTFHCQAASHPNLFAGLVSAVAGAGISEVRSTPGPCMAKVTTSVDITDFGKISRSNTCFDSRSIDTAATADLDDLLSVVTANPFFPLTIKSAEVNVELTSGRNSAVIDHLEMSDARFESGSNAVIGVVIRPYKQATVTKRVSLDIPRNLPAGRYAVQVRGGNVPAGFSFGGITLRSQGAGAAELSAPISAKQMIKRYMEREKNTDLVARLVLSSSSVVLEGERMTGLPAHLDQPLRSARISGLRLERDEIKVTQEMPWVLSGQQVVVINVSRRDVIEQPTGGTSFSGASPSSAGSSSPPPGFDTEAAALRDDLVRADVRALTAGQNLPIYPVNNFEFEFPIQTNSPKSLATQKKSVKSAATTATPAVVEPSSPLVETVKDKPIARQPIIWKQSGKQDFGKGELIGTVVNAKGELVTGASIQSTGQLGDDSVWALCKGPHGTAYAGTGPHAKVLLIASNKSASLLATLPEVSVNTITTSSDGTIIAGTSPNGRTYRIKPNGEFNCIHTAKEKYVLSSCTDSNGNTFVGTGGGVGHVYRISPSGVVIQVKGIETDHVTAMASEAYGTLLVGTGNQGIVYRVGQNGEVSTVYDAAEPIISGISVSNHSIYVSTAPKGAVYRIDGLSAKSVIDSTRGPVQCLVSSSAGPIGFGGSNLYDLGIEKSESQSDLRRDVEFLSACELSDGVFVTGGSVGGQLYFVNPKSTGSTQYISQTRDAKRNAIWRNLRWNGTTGSNSKVTFSTRTGNSAEPDASWSDWMAVSVNKESPQIESPAARFLQYKIDFQSGSELAAVKEVTVSYLPENSAPKVTLTLPSITDAISGKQTLKWEASDADKDTLSFEVFTQREGEQEWKPLPASGDTKSSTKTPISPNSSATPTSGIDKLKEVQAELDKHPDMPAALREAVLQRARELTGTIATVPQPAASTRESLRTFDSSQLQDGIYRFKVIASDRPSNALGFLTDESVSSPITICNAKPFVVLGKEGISTNPDGTVLLSGFAFQTMVTISSVQVRVDGGDWLSAAPSGEAFDKSLVGFQFTTAKLLLGEHKIEIKVFNSAGNSEIETTKVVSTGK